MLITKGGSVLTTGRELLPRNFYGWHFVLRYFTEFFAARLVKYMTLNI